MRTLKGIILMLIAVAIAGLEIYFLLIEPLVTENTVSISSGQYWSIAIPLVIIIFGFMALLFTVGFTIIRTPEPLRLTYEDAYNLSKKKNE